MDRFREIGLDADDVIFDFWGAAIPVFNEKYGKTSGKEEFHQFDSVCPVYGITAQEFLDTVVEENILEKMKPYPGVVEAIQLFKQRGHRVRIITSRAYHPLAHDVTAESLSRFFIPFDDLHIKADGKTKADYLETPVDIFVDDLPQNLIDIKSSGKAKRLALITQPWNKRADGFERYRNLADIVLG